MTSSTSRSHIPPLPLALSFGAAALALLLVAGARVTGFSPKQELEQAHVLQSRLLRFAGDAETGVQVIDVETGETLARTSREGFIPGVLRGLNRLRKTNEAAPAEAYRLERLDNGQLLLIDTATGVSLDLNAYGRANAAIFKDFLATGDQS